MELEPELELELLEPDPDPDPDPEPDPEPEPAVPGSRRHRSLIYVDDTERLLVVNRGPARVDQRLPSEEEVHATDTEVEEPGPPAAQRRRLARGFLPTGCTITIAGELWGHARWQWETFERGVRSGRPVADRLPSARSFYFSVANNSPIFSPRLVMFWTHVVGQIFAG